MYSTIVRIAPVLLAASLAARAAVGQAKTVVRGRNEGTARISASNVLGNGNITAFADLGGGVSKEALSAVARLGGHIGIAGIMQLTAGASVIDYQKLGPADAHLTITLPGNDKLRFFGLSVSGDLYLSTSQDTVSLGADSTRPLYSPFLMPSLVADLDWIARPKQMPLKTYLSIGLVDDPQLLYRYTQLAAAAGAEWKTYQHSVFVDAGVSLYKEKRNKLDPGDDGFEQFRVWIEPGGRYRIRSRFSIIASLGVTVYQQLKNNTALEPHIASLSVSFEAPILFKETNTEAIRTLVFMEQKEQQETDSFAENVESGRGLLGEIDTMISGLEEGGETFDYSKEREDLAKRRKEIQKKMAEIEQILKEIE
ncbi:MAG: hypothetical protein GF418_16560 [Chitinivibrionales bacterium]|nr:hypothetical protein [Chitinivibrionales bacterium]MBD3397235.1 hypothetical protein [Chitinivibrionales bacterium]